ncbi:MAG: hypothetical protein C0592_01965 [Marinilabiliales bacterium]|nr:MAG: hypothetical protein C0592_01965 [Marinilabiliales bacterium]
MKKSIFKVMAIFAVLAIIGVSCTEDDITNPTITLTGSETMTIDLGDDFTDPGATANDDKDGDLTSQISVTGTVTTDEVGVYTLTYTVSDEAGNTATATRTVYVQADELAGAYSSSLSGDGTWGTFTDNYTLTVTASATTYNKLILSPFSNYPSLTVSAIVGANTLDLGQTVIYDYDGDTYDDELVISSLGSSYEVNTSGATPISSILTINYKIDYSYGDGTGTYTYVGYDIVTETFTRQ